MNIFLLFDKKEKNSFLYTGLKAHYSNVFEIDNPKDSNIKTWMKGALQLLRMSDKNDILICWFDFQAVLCYWFSLLLFQKRNIIALNIMLKDKPTIKNKCVSYLYKKALTNKRFKATFATKEYANLCCGKLKIDIDKPILRDVYIPSIQAKKQQDNKRSVFVGGRNARDWKTAFAVAEKMQDVSFTFVLPPDEYDKYISKNYANVQFHKSVTLNEFISLQKESSITYLPLNTEIPAGLIVLYQSAQIHQMVVTSDTCTTRGYITNGFSGALVPLFSVDEAIKTIDYYLANIDKRNFCCDNLLSFLELECNQNKYIETIIELIELFPN